MSLGSQSQERFNYFKPSNKLQQSTPSMKLKSMTKFQIPKTTKNGPGSLTNSFIATTQRQIQSDNESPLRKQKQKINNLNKTSSSKNFKNLNKSKFGSL